MSFVDTPAVRLRSGLRGSARAGLLAATVLTAALLAFPGAASAQDTATADGEIADAAGEQEAEIVVTGSRVQRAGFDAPTPTTVVGADELTQGARANIGEVLNDLPSFRATTTAATNPGNTGSGTVRLDLRGLGTSRTLTLLNGRRFSGGEDLNTVPMNLVKQVEVVTGGASAAWGSGAVAGVANIILNDDLEGISLGGRAGVSSRGDGARYELDGSFGTHFADDRGHFMIGAQWLDYQGIPDRNSRPRLGTTGTFTNPAYTRTNGEHQYLLVPDVNAANAGRGGLILTGALAGETFNPDGTLRQFQFGSVRNGPSMIGGADGWNTFDGLAVTQPYERIGTFARVSFDVTDNVKLWVDGSYMRMEASAPYFPDSDRGAVIRSDNAFLSPEIRNRLEAADQDRFTMGRWFQDRIYQLDYHRENIEGAIGIDGEFGDGWRYSAYYDHGEYSNYVAISNVRIRQNYLNAVDAVIDPATGRPVCRIALTNPSTNCVPVNLFGEGNISDAAAGYIFGAAVIDQRSKLDTGGVSLRGDPFSTWAGPVSIAVGAEARRESVFTVVDPISAVNGFVSSNRSPTIGSFNVKEGFAELVLPLLNVDASKIEFNGAVRYSDYSNSGGIWSWKAGLTDRIFDDLLLRATYSRDIRSGNMGELFTSRATNFSNIVDPVTGTTILASMFTGGNPNLKPERANTLTLGGSYAPGFVPGLNLSVDYYAIKIKDVIATISAQDTVTRCVNGNTALCNLITRNSAGAITSIEASYINLSRYETSGVDVEASYNLPLERIGLEDAGTVRLRALATYVHSLITDDGVVRIQGAGTVGDNTSFGTPKWRGTASLSYDAGDAELDLRVRYVGGGVFSRTLDVANNHIGARSYVDLGARFDAGNMTFSVDVANLFDRAPPLTTGFNPHYDVIGRYLSAGVRVNF